MFRRLRPEGADEGDQSSRAIQVVPQAPDEELERFHHHPTYSMGGAMKYILVLSVLLWWLPTFGQMIAGYIGGRKSGGPWRGVIASIVPVLLIVLLAWGLERGLLGPWLESMRAIPGGLGGFLERNIPPVAPYVTFVLGYLAAFVDALRGTLAMGSNGYLVTIVFAYIGGILAEQNRREAGASKRTSVGISIHQPFFGGFQNPTTAWEGRHQPAEFGNLGRIPVANAVLSPPQRPKVDARRADAGASDGSGPHRGHPTKDAPRAEPKTDRKAPESHEKEIAREVATRKWVERALRQYESAHRR